MFPIFIKFGPFEIFGHTFGPLEVHWYGVLITIGFLLGVYLAMRDAKRNGINPDLILDLGFWVLLAGLIGSRVLFDIVNWQSYYDACFNPSKVGLSEPACWEVIKFWKGGLVWYGGLLAAIPVGIWYVKKHNLPLWKTTDIVIPSVSLGHAFGRMGCYSAGCCFGRPTDSIFGVSFPPGSMAQTLHMERWPDIASHFHGSMPVHPTELYESVGELLIFITLVVTKRYKRFHGQVFITYLIIYPILRSIVEFFRGDHARGYLISWNTTIQFEGYTLTDTAGISTSQFISILVAIGASITLVYLLRRNHRLHSKYHLD